MNIVLAHYKIQDYGGIVNYSECLAQGLKNLGHRVESVMLRNKGKSGYPREIDHELDDGWEYGEGLGLWMHQKQGWQGMYQINYTQDMSGWETMAEEADLVIYVVPVPTCSKEYKGDTDWIELYNQLDATQLLVVHDGNMQKLYPHINQITESVDGIICVHDAAFNSCSVIEDAPRVLIPNPHNVPLTFRYHLPMEGRDKGFLSLQTFKRWKHVDDLIRAIPHLPERYEKIMAGGGIECHYMTSKTKVKQAYLEPDGSRIWDNALNNGMRWLGYTTTEERDETLATVRLLVDPSWSKSYSEYGAHFNRVMVEAMVQGCVPVCTDLGMKNSSFFKAGVNYIEVPYDSTPEQYAAILESSIEDTELLNTIQGNNYELVQRFAKEKVAADIVNFADRPAKKYSWEKHSWGKSTDKFREAAAKKMEYFYDL